MADTQEISSQRCCLSNYNYSIETVRIIDPLLGVEVKNITILVCYFVICGTMSFFGIIGNIVNLITFSKQGYSNTMNISLSGLAVSDMCTLLIMAWWDVCINPAFLSSDHVILSSEVQYLTAGWPHCLFARITCIITVFITMERCLCVVFPLKVKKIITKSVTIISIISIYMTQFMTCIPSYYVRYIDWKFFPERNRSLLGMYRRDNWEQVDGISFFLQSSMQTLSFTLLIFFTVLLLVNLNRKTKWRKASTSDTQKETITSRDKKLVRMVIFIALILLICFTPGMIAFIVMAVAPECTLGGALDTVFYVTWALPFMCQTFNSSINIFIYYRMSSRYRSTVNEMFSWFLKPVGNTRLRETTHND